MFEKAWGFARRNLPLVLVPFLLLAIVGVAWRIVELALMAVTLWLGVKAVKGLYDRNAELKTEVKRLQRELDARPARVGVEGGAGTLAHDAERLFGGGRR